MSVKVERDDPKDPASNVWFTAQSDDRAELGAYIPANARDDDPSLSVFWCGDTSRSTFWAAVDQTEKLLFDKDGPVRVTLYAFGPLKEQLGPITLKSSDHPGLVDYLDKKSPVGCFSAYRAELEGTEGHIILWANVVDLDLRGLENGGDNIGICTSPKLFNGPARGLIEETIEKTRQGKRPTTRVLGRATVSGLLNEIAKEVNQTIHPSALGNTRH
jgi:hypothetical protein